MPDAALPDQSIRRTPAQQAIAKAWRSTKLYLICGIAVNGTRDAAHIAGRAACLLNVGPRWERWLMAVDRARQTQEIRRCTFPGLRLDPGWSATIVRLLDLSHVSAGSGLRTEGLSIRQQYERPLPLWGHRTIA